MKINIQTANGKKVIIHMDAESSLEDLNEEYRRQTGEELYGNRHVISTTDHLRLAFNEKLSVYGIKDESIIYQTINPKFEQMQARERLLLKTEAEQKALPFLAFQQLSETKSVNVDEHLPLLPFVTNGVSHSLSLSDVYIRLSDNQKKTVQQYIVDKLESDYRDLEITETRKLVADARAAVVLVPGQSSETSFNGNYQAVLTDKALKDIPRSLLIKLTLRSIPDENQVYEIGEGGDLKIIWLNQSHILASEAKYSAAEVSEVDLQAMLDGEDKETQKKARQIQDQHMAVISVPISYVPNEQDTCQIFIKGLTSKTHTYDVSLSDSIRTIKRMYGERTGVDPNQARLIYGGKQLEDHAILKDYGIEEQATLNHVLRHRGVADNSDSSCASSYAITTTQAVEVDYVPVKRPGRYEIQTSRVKAVVFQSIVTKSEKTSDKYIENSLHAAEKRANELAKSVFGPVAQTSEERYPKRTNIVVVIGDSTIDNKVWVGRGGAILNRLKEAVGIRPDTREEKIKASQSCFPPELSVLDHLQKELSDYDVQDYTNDGFTTTDVLLSGCRNKVFAGGFLLSYPLEMFDPLDAAKLDISKADCIILSIGGNNFRQYLIDSGGYYDFSTDKWIKRTPAEKEQYMRENFATTLEKMRSEYIQIVKIIRSQNLRAKIILTTQYYPSASSIWVDYIYPLMKEVGRVLGIGRNPNNPMDVIHEIMKQTYMQVLESVQDSNVVVADVTSSLDPFDKNNHAMQIEPSGAGGKKMAQMLEYMVTQPTKPGYVYRFLPAFFATQNNAVQVEELPLQQWSPKHPHEFTGKACYDPNPVIKILNEEKDYDELDQKDLGAIYKNEEIKQSIIVLSQVSRNLVTRVNFQKILDNVDLQIALSSAHGYLNSGRFGFWRKHGMHGRTETEKFVRSLMIPDDLSKDNITSLMREWIKTSNVHNSSRAYYAHQSGFFEQKESNASSQYVTASSKERISLLNEMKLTR